MVGRNICAPRAPSTLLTLCHHFGVLNFEMDPRFCKTCTLSDSHLCLDKPCRGLCNRTVLTAHWIDRVQVRRSKFCLYVAVRKVLQIRHVSMFTGRILSRFTCRPHMQINIITSVQFMSPLSPTFFVFST